MTTIIELQAELQNLKNCRISYTDIGKALDTGRANISKRANSNSILKEDEIKKIEKYFDVILSRQTVNNVSKENDIIKILYWAGLPEELKHPEYTFVLAQRVSIEHGWGVNPDDLCIIPMVGDKMTKYWYPINDGDILIIDTSKKHIVGNGVYFATSQNNTRFWVREMQNLYNNDIEFKGFAPSGNTIRTVSKEELLKVDFKIIGKVIKNVSFRL